jgi:ribosomal protein S18 acetylase RimI-like enzyme
VLYNLGNVTLDIIPFDDPYAADFKQLNLEWLNGFGLFEDADLKHLDHPRDGIIDKGGTIWMAVDPAALRPDGRPGAVGTVAIMPHAPGVAELIKLAVTSSVQGRGVGRRLCQCVIDRAKAMDVRKLELVSSHKLTSALKLYESLGFEYGPLPEDPGYQTTDIYMSKNL